MTGRNDERRTRKPAAPSPSNRPKSSALAAPALLAAAGTAASIVSLTHWPFVFWPGILAGAAVAAFALAEVRARWKIRQMANRERRRGGYVH